jgi:hypothetical protein
MFSSRLVGYVVACVGYMTQGVGLDVVVPFLIFHRHGYSVYNGINRFSVV